MDSALRHRVNVARVALREQKEFFHNQLGKVVSEWKADDTRVTFADFAISERVLRALRSSFPKDDAFSEESSSGDEMLPLTAKYSWVLDPVDGTNNYALGMRTCGISLALLKGGQPYYGFIYDGSTGELIEGGPGQPLLVDGRRWRLDPRPFDQQCGMVAVHFPLAAGRGAQLTALLEQYRVRSLGSAALHLAYSALGRLDGFFDEKVRIWDIAAGLALLAAAGKQVRWLSDQPFPLRVADFAAPHLRLYGGSAGFVTAMEGWLDQQS
jgi:myo-inositol-1(or 4)-monophosphatase